MAERNCEQCGNAFVPRGSNQKSCSKICWNKGRYFRKHAQIRASQKRYYVANRAKLIAQSNEWRERQHQTKPWAPLLGTAKYRAKKEGLPFNLTAEWALATWKGVCEISGIPFVLNKRRSVFSPTIDKIIPNLGYEQSNCRFVLFGVNALKYNSTDTDMYAIAAAITACHTGLSIDQSGQSVNKTEPSFHKAPSCTEMR